MTLLQKIVVGGLGAIAPLVVALATIDARETFTKVTLALVFGYLVRAAALFASGSIVAMLHKDETNPWRVFEIGIIAPSLLTAMLAAHHGEGGSHYTPPGDAVHAAAPIGFHLIPTVYAAPPAPAEKTFSAPKETAAQQFIRGLRGSGVENVWFVLAGDHLTLAEAQKKADTINAKSAGFRAEAYKELPPSASYAVVIGANLVFSDAESLRQRARNANLATTLWTFPK